jgi:hypothetical protein
MVFKWILKKTEIKNIAEFDSDNSYRFIDLKIGFNNFKKNNSDIAIGSKYLSNSIIVKRTIARSLISLGVSLICRFLFNSNIKDYTNGQRIYKSNFLKRILKKKNNVSSPNENLNILLYAIIINGKITEYPSYYIANDTSHWMGIYSFSFNFLLTVKLIFTII